MRDEREENRRAHPIKETQSKFNYFVVESLHDRWRGRVDARSLLQSANGPLDPLPLSTQTTNYSDSKHELHAVCTCALPFALIPCVRGTDAPLIYAVVVTYRVVTAVVGIVRHNRTPYVTAAATTRRKGYPCVGGIDMKGGDSRLKIGRESSGDLRADWIRARATEERATKKKKNPCNLRVTSSDNPGCSDGCIRCTADNVQ